MKRRVFLKLMGLAGLSVATPACSDALVKSSVKQESGRFQKRPNVIFIMSDDQGSAHFGFMKDTFERNQLSEYLLQRAFYGKEPYDVEKSLQAAASCTPTIDRLRSEGMLFSNFLTGPSCAPTRAALLTAKYPQRWGCYVNFDVERVGMGEETVLATCLKDAGYRTACIGKWHAGALEFRHPLDNGFDYFFGFEGSWVTYHNSDRLYRGRQKAKAEGYLTEQITNEALAFIDDSVKSQDPFFLYLPHLAPHSPTGTTPEKYHERFNTGSLVMDKLFGAIYAMDEGIGKIIDRLHQHGVDRDTLVIFTIDNGSPFWFPLPGNGANRGFKMTSFDGAHRVPMVAWWPRQIEPDSESNCLASIMDIFPTAIDAAGGRVPEDIDGKSLLDVLTGREKLSEDRVLFWAGGHTAMTEEEWAFLDVRARQEGKSKQWFPPPSWAVWKGRWKLVNAATGWPRLYDVGNDPREIIDLSNEHPDVVEELSLLYLEWIKDKPEPPAWDKKKWKSLKTIAGKH